MHATRFDQLSRGLAQRPNRRMLLGAAAGSLLGLPGPQDVGAKKNKKRKKARKKCKKRGACWTFKKGKGKGKCKRKQELAACGGGQFCQGGVCRCPEGQGNSGGVCGTLPIGCNEPGVPCDDGPCCSDTCAVGEGGIDRCQPSTQGEPCVRNDYCEIGLQCVGFTCRPV